MIKEFKDFNTTQAYTETKQLPRGGYVCRIVGAKSEDNSDGSQYVKVAFDIAEGEHKDFFQDKFDQNTNEDKKWSGVYTLSVPKDDGSEKDTWTKRRFKTFTNALEDSNDGYHFDWDETKFKDKLVGMIFNYREYEFNGMTGMTPNVARVTSVEEIRKGEYKIPQDRLLNKKKAESISGFVNVPESATEVEIPF